MSDAQSGDTLPVLIVGGGPVGMTLASELARYGIDVRIVDDVVQMAQKKVTMTRRVVCALRPS